MSKKNDDQVRDAMDKIASGRTSKADRDAAFGTIGRIDRAERRGR